ncbi:hypothetical protein A2U01_0094478, partial [Trifolium medium]|nr:hypothetical protein [Trifolium medium]
KIDVMQESGVVVVDGARRRLNVDEVVCFCWRREARQSPAQGAVAGI